MPPSTYNWRLCLPNTVQVVADFSLGTFDSDATGALSDGSEVGFQKEPQSAEAALRYYSQVYTNGTSCDLTDQLRQTEVRISAFDPRIVVSV